MRDARAFLVHGELRREQRSPLTHSLPLGCSSRPERVSEIAALQHGNPGCKPAAPVGSVVWWPLR
jgi:hypothetical protein